MSTVKDTSRFFEMDNTPSKVFPELTELQEYIIKEMAKGRTVTSIAKEMAPVYGDIAKEISKGIKQGKEEAEKTDENKK